MTETALCPHFQECGGCAYLSCAYEESKHIKETQVKRLLAPALETQTESYEWEDALESPSIFAYRNKMEFTFGDARKDGPLALGMHKRRSFFDIVSVPSCRIVDKDFQTVLRATLDFFSPLYEKKEISFYHKKRKRGYLRHLLVRKASRTGEILISLVTAGCEQLATDSDKVGADSSLRNGDAQTGDDARTAENGVATAEGARIAEKEARLLDAYRVFLLAQTYEGTIAGILHTVNNSVADAVKDEGTRVLYGAASFEEELLGMRFTITPFSFFQTNSGGAEVLYETVRRYVSEALRKKDNVVVAESGAGSYAERLGTIDGARIERAETKEDAGERAEDAMDGATDDARVKTVYDLYCGTGTITQLVSSVAERVVGVEIVPEAIEAARESASRNGADNCEFICGDVLKVLDELSEPPDLMILDPPRSGVHPKALPKLLRYGAPHIVYVSCKPESLARDLPFFLHHGYVVRRLVCIDQFPWTKHVETVVLLSKLSESPKIGFSLDVERLPLTSADTKATYEEIRYYVENKYGLKVSNLYIAQVKQEYGIIERENYNKGKDGHPIPQCPPEKREAIIDALTHFQMIPAKEDDED